MGLAGAGRSVSFSPALECFRKLPTTVPTPSVDARELASASFEILPHPPYLLAALQHLGHTTLHSNLGCRQGQARQGNAVNGFGRSDMNPAATTTQGARNYLMKTRLWGAVQTDGIARGSKRHGVPLNIL